MSVEAISWALNDAPDVPPQTVAVLIGLANHAGPDGRGSYPSQPTLARYTRKGQRAIRKDLVTLEEKGLIRRGDQRLTDHLPPDKRPVVWDLAMGSGAAQIGGNHTTGRNHSSPRNQGSARNHSSRPGGTTVPPATGTTVPPNRPVEPTTEPPTGGSVDRSPSGSRRAGEDDDRKIDQAVIDAIHAATGRTVPHEWATKVRRQILTGRNPADPLAYVAAAIRGEPTRFLPAKGDPSNRSLAEALAAARGEL